MKKPKNINEQLNRMKSLMTEERLYGNLIDKNLITEQEKLLKAVLKLIKPNKIYRIGGDLVKVTKDSKGYYNVQKNIAGDVKKPKWSTPRPLKAADFYSKEVINTVTTSVNKNINSVDGLENYLSEGFGNDLKMLLKDFEKNIGGFKGLDIDSYVDELITILGTGVDNKIFKQLDDYTLWKGVPDMNTFEKMIKKRLGSTYELIDMVPNMKDRIYKSYIKHIDNLGGVDNAFRNVKKPKFTGKNTIDDYYRLLLDNPKFKNRLLGLMKPKGLVKYKPPKRYYSAVYDMVNWGKVQARFNYKQLINQGYLWKDLDAGQQNYLKARWKNIEMPDGHINPHPTKADNWKENVRKHKWGVNTVSPEFFNDKGLKNWVTDKLPYYVRTYPGLKTALGIPAILSIWAWQSAMLVAENVWHYTVGTPDHWLGQLRTGDADIMFDQSTGAAREESCKKKLLEMHNIPLVSEDLAVFKLTSDEKFTLSDGQVVTGLKGELEECMTEELEKIKQAFRSGDMAKQGIQLVKDEGLLAVFMFGEKDIETLLSNSDSAFIKKVEDSIDPQHGDEGSTQDGDILDNMKDVFTGGDGEGSSAYKMR